MSGTVVLIHTVAPLLAVFDRLAADLLPGVKLFHVLDEPLLERVRRRGRIADEDGARLAAHVAEAATIGADAVLVTCSTISPAVDLAATALLPVVKIDEAMIAEAVRLGRRIGVIATNPTTLEPTRGLLAAEAARTVKAIETELVLVEGALPALLAGDGATHDRLVRAAISDLAQRSDVVVLAQATIARVLAVLPERERPVPILSSPHLALEQIGAVLNMGRDSPNDHHCALWRSG